MQGVHHLVAGVIGPSKRFFSLDILEKNKWGSTDDEEWCGYRQAQQEAPEGMVASRTSAQRQGWRLVECLKMGVTYC